MHITHFLSVNDLHCLCAGCANKFFLFNCLVVVVVFFFWLDVHTADSPLFVVNQKSMEVVYRTGSIGLVSFWPKMYDGVYERLHASNVARIMC